MSYRAVAEYGSGIRPERDKEYGRQREERVAHPIVVMKLVWNESSEKRSSRQLFPTPVHTPAPALNTRSLGDERLIVQVT